MKIELGWDERDESVRGGKGLGEYGIGTGV